MKTSRNISQRKNILLISLLALLLSAIAGCSKDDLALNRDKDELNEFSSARQMLHSNSGNSNNRLFKSISIDHFSARTSIPDYKITVKADATVVFEGRRNCELNQTIEFRASDIMMRKLIFYYNEIDFYSIIDTLSLAADLPMVSTTCSGNEFADSKTMIDYYGNYPTDLIKFRNLVEEVLGIEKYVKKKYPLVKTSEIQF